MDEDQTSSELSHGSEARPNTPFADPFAELHKNNTKYATTTEDPAVQLWIPEDNTSVRNHPHPLKPQISYKHKLNKQKTLPNLPPLTEEPGLSSNERTSENEIEKQESGSGGKKIDNKFKCFKKLKKSLQKPKESAENVLTIANCSKSVVALPKIDTYCISYIRPSTNHGFSYAVSSNELLKGKNTTSGKIKRKKTTSKLNSTSENGFPHPGNMYLLFRAPSRACGLNIPGLRARPKELQHLKGAKQLEKAKTTVQTNIVRLPDINEDMWK